MSLILSFLAEKYGIMPYFPNYGDSVKVSLSYYLSSTYPFLAGCFRGFCIFAGTYKGFVQESTFLLRNHSSVVDTVNMDKRRIQEWVSLQRYFRNGNLLMGFEVGFLREVYTSLLTSRHDVFENNRLGLGFFKQGMLMGGVAGLGNSYILLRFRRFNRDSTLSGGDTTGWFITVPDVERNPLEVLVNINVFGASFKFNYRDSPSFWVDREFYYKGALLLGGFGYSENWILYANAGFNFKTLKLLLGLTYARSPYVGFGVKFVP